MPALDKSSEMRVLHAKILQGDCDTDITQGRVTGTSLPLYKHPGEAWPCSGTPAKYDGNSNHIWNIIWTAEQKETFS